MISWKVLQFIERDRADLFVQQLETGNAFIKQAGLEDKITMIDETLVDIPIWMYLTNSKDSARDAIKTVLEEMVKNREIFRKEKPLGSVDVYLTDFRILNEKKQQTKQTIIQSVIMVAILGISILLVLINLLNRPLSVVQHSVEEISEGEGHLTQSLDIKSKDEVGLLSISFNSFVHKLKDIIINLKKTIELFTGGKEILEAMRFLNDVSSSVKEQSNSMGNDANNIHNSVDTLRRISSEVLHGMGEIAAGTEEAMSEVNTLSTQLSDVIDDLESEVNKFKTR